MKSPITAMVIMSCSLLGSNTYATNDNQSIQQEQMGSNIQMQNTQLTNQTLDEAFLDANKNKPGVITLADGLQYQILKEGNGPKPKATDTVTVHYQGTLIDGTEFDSSYKRGVPAAFPVNAVIPGWVEALQLMNVGSTWVLYIPAKLAYGERGAGSLIGPNKTLIFKVELISIQ